MNYYDIITSVEQEYGVDIAENDLPTDILCQHTSCIHSECECWTVLRAALVEIVKRDLRQNIANAMAAIAFTPEGSPVPMDIGTAGLVFK